MEFVSQVRTAFLKPRHACGPAFPAADEKLAWNLCGRKGVAGTSPPGHLVRLCPEIRRHAQRSTAVAHHQLGDTLSRYNRGSQAAPDSSQLLGPCTEKMEDGKAVAADRKPVQNDA